MYEHSQNNDLKRLRPETALSPCLTKLMDYNVLPDEKTQSKLDYFYSPYNNSIEFSKFMKFGKE